MHKDWCGKPCGECEHPCTLDSDSYCSPDCEYLGEDGEMSSLHCKECDAYLACKEAEENFERMTSFNENRMVDFGGDDVVVLSGNTKVDVSCLGYFDALEEAAWDFIKLCADRFDLTIKPKYPEEDDDDDCVDWYAAKTVLESVLGLFGEAGVEFITGDETEEADAQ